MFYIRGEVLSDQFDHFKLILFCVPECSLCKKFEENRIKWEFFLQGGSPTPFFLLKTSLRYFRVDQHIKKFSKEGGRKAEKVKYY